MRPLNDLFEECFALGLTTSQRDFGRRLWNRSENWFSSTVSRERRLSTESLLRFYFSLASMRLNGPDHADALDRLRSEIWQEIASRVRA